MLVTFFLEKLKRLDSEEIEIMGYFLSPNILKSNPEIQYEQVDHNLILVTASLNEISVEVLEKVFSKILSKKDFDLIFKNRKENVKPEINQIDKDISFTAVKKFSHWGRLKESLELKLGKESKARISNLDLESQKIINRILQCQSEGETNIQGLIVGYVQSGKTENMMAVASKSFDNGFKVVIVLSGILNSLRWQTQRRFDLDWTKNQASLNFLNATEKYFQGRNPLPRDLIDVITFAGPSDDIGEFQRTSKVPSSLICSVDTSDQITNVLIIIKKNTKVLQSLKDSFKNIGAGPGSKINLPVLIIDDESDQATINTKKLKKEVSTINAHVRELLADYLNSYAYIGYTATPYANVFIDKEEKDLYPKDFIISLEKKDGYVGAEELHGDPFSDSAGLPLFEFVPEDELISVKNGETRFALNRGIQGASTLENSIINYLISSAYGRARNLDQPFTL